MVWKSRLRGDEFESTGRWRPFGALEDHDGPSRRLEISVLETLERGVEGEHATGVIRCVERACGMPRLVVTIASQSDVGGNASSCWARYSARALLMSLAR